MGEGINLEGFVDVAEEVKYQVNQHEVLLAFNDDEGADAFRVWLDAVGWRAFIKWGCATRDWGEYFNVAFPPDSCAVNV